VARIRTLKPEILEDEKTAGLSDTSFRLFTSLIILADDHGNVRADVRWLQGQVWWVRNDPPNVLSALIELVRAPLITVYGVRGGTYAHLLGWEKHQRIDNAGKNRVPFPNDADAKVLLLDPSDSRGNSPQFAAKFGEIPLDPDPDQDPEGEGEREPAALRGGSQPTRAKARRVPETWQPRPSDARLSSPQLENELEKFRDWEFAKPKSDWDAAWRNWQRTANERSGGQQQRRALTPLEQQMERVRQLEAEERAKGGSQ
jgi:hypothetical protein